MYDYHIHPDYSIDADKVSIESYCKKALKIGLREICFTPHFESDPQRSHLDGYVRLNNNYHPMNDWLWFEKFLFDVKTNAIKFAPLGLKVKSGVEIGYDLGLEDTIYSLLNRFSFDFVLGSVHCLDHHAISSSKESAQYFTGKTVKQVVTQYYKVIEKMVDSQLFDCIGHLDLYRRYGRQYLGVEIELAHRGLVEPMLKKIASANMALEINTSSRRRGHREFHPGTELLSLAVKHGIKYFTVGSDSHKLAELGDAIPEACSLLKRLGQGVTTFDKNKPTITYF